MGRHDEYSEEGRAAMRGDKADFMRDCQEAEKSAWADAQLGKRVRALLAHEEAPGDSAGIDPNGSPASPTSIPLSSLPRMEVDHVKPSGEEAFRPAEAAAKENDRGR